MKTSTRPLLARAAGDVGYVDEDNYLYIVDRAKDMIITGGFNVYSTEVEQALMARGPRLRGRGLPDEKWGERVVAVIQAAPSASVDTEDLIGFVKARIGSVKAPKQVWIWTTSRDRGSARSSNPRSRR